MIGDFGIVSRVRRPVRDTTPVDVLHGERCPNVEKIQRPVGPPGELLSENIPPKSHKLSTVAAPTAATTAHWIYDGNGRRRINTN